MRVMHICDVGLTKRPDDGVDDEVSALEGESGKTVAVVCFAIG